MAESVWDYPRPPRLEPSSQRVQVIHRGRVIAESGRTLRVLETSHPPVYYIPPADIAMASIRPSTRRGSVCEFKGTASYWSLVLEEEPSLQVADVAWSYPRPLAPYSALRDHLAFYASRMDACFVDGEQVQPQPGDFYGGWITSRVSGPFKGAKGTLGW